MDQHVLVIHSAGDLAYLERLRPKGFCFTLIKKCPTAEDRLRFDRVIDFDYQTGTEATLALVNEVHAASAVHGVTTFSESGVIMAAIIADHLGLPGNPPAAALRARNKYLMRQALRDAGLDSPEFFLVRHASEVTQIAAGQKQGMVLKPISGSSSYGVTRIKPSDTIADVETHMEDVRRYISNYSTNNPQYPFEFWLPPAGHGIDAEDVLDPAADFLVEGFLGGQQVSVDGFVCKGHVTTCGVIEIERVKGSDYFLEYEEWMPSRLPVAEGRRIEDVVSQAVGALGLRNGAFHCELKVSHSGIYVLEIAARRGADNIGDFLRQVMGVDVYEEAVRIACGQDRRRDSLQPKRHMKMRYFLPEVAGRLTAVEGVDEVRSDPRVSELVIDFNAGDEILVPPEGFEFLGYVSVIGDTPDQADAALEDVYGRVRFVVAPEVGRQTLADPGAPLGGRLLVVQPSADYARRVLDHAPEAVFLVTPERATELESDNVIVADLDDVPHVVSAVRAWSTERGCLDGITCFVCEFLELTANLAREFELPFHSVDAVRRSRQKDQSLEIWQAAGVSVPESRFVGGLPDLVEFARRVSPPWILKPTNRTGSEWVLRVDGHEDLLAAHLTIRDGLSFGDQRLKAREARYLAQRLVQGREVSADVYLKDGQLVDVLRCTEKAFAEKPGLAGLVSAYYPASLSDTQMDVLRRTTMEAAKALGVTDGIVMVDGILRDGILYLLEMGLRPGGDCLPDLCRVSSGYDPIRAACQVALGRAPDRGRREPEAIAAVHLMADLTGEITRLNLDCVGKHPAVLHIDPYRSTGDRLRVWSGSYDDRILAACLVRFSRPEDLLSLTNQLSDLIEIDVVKDGTLEVSAHPTLEAA